MLLLCGACKKMFEALVRAYICHSPHSRLRDVAADSKDEEDSKISSESERKDNKSNPRQCIHTYIYIYIYIFRSL